MQTVQSINNSVRHLPLAQLEGCAVRGGVAQQFRKRLTELLRLKRTEQIWICSHKPKTKARAERAANWKRTVKPSSRCAANIGLTARSPNGSMSMASRSHFHPFIVSVKGQSPAGHAAAIRSQPLNQPGNRHHFPSQHHQPQPNQKTNIGSTRIYENNETSPDTAHAGQGKHGQKHRSRRPRELAQPTRH